MIYAYYQDFHFYIFIQRAKLKTKIPTNQLDLNQQLFILLWLIKWVTDQVTRPFEFHLTFLFLNLFCHILQGDDREWYGLFKQYIMDFFK